MRKSNGLTLVELLIIIALLIVLIISFLPPFPNGPGVSASLANCLQNMRILTMSWTCYSDDNNGVLIGGDIGQAEYDWIAKPVVTDRTDIDGQKTNIRNGKLYVNNIKVYHCPADDRLDDDQGPWLSYSIVGSLNGQDRYEEDTRNYNVVTKYDQITCPEEKIVFVEEDAEFGWNPRSWQIYDPEDITKWVWQDPISIRRHKKKSNFSFSDGHAECRKWQDERTLAMSVPPAEEGTMAGHTVGHIEQKDNPDLLWMKQKYMWVEK